MSEQSSFRTESPTEEIPHGHPINRLKSEFALANGLAFDEVTDEQVFEYWRTSEILEDAEEVQIEEYLHKKGLLR